MKKVIQIEELALTAASIYLIHSLELPIIWWLYLLLFFTPDVGMLGYLINSRVGAITYNLFHHMGIAIAVIAIGILMSDNYVLVSGLLLFGHASFDRIFGYGLKYFTGFKHTHLGELK